MKDRIERNIKEREGTVLPIEKRMLASIGHAFEAAERDARRELERLQGGDGVIASAQQIQDLSLDIRTNVERWLRLKAAKLLLERSIERYRPANEHPLVRRAGELLSSITASGENPIIRLAIDYADADHPVIVGVRREGLPCKVKGMSDGTRDQLYLSLRIAAIERFAADRESLPFIADDLFVSSDDDRTAAGIKALAELGRSNQVILFTHHRSVVDAALATVPDAFLRVHNLAGSKAPLPESAAA